jgi:betaine-aldehyde dehydrogenase
MANFFSSGQVCTNGTRVFVPESLLPQFEKTLLDKMQHIRPGDPLDTSVNFGPLVSKPHHAKVISYIQHGLDSDDAKLLVGGPSPPSSLPNSVRHGYWVQPTVFTQCRDDMKISTDEIFGPVMCILPYRTVDEVIARANNTAMGLAAGVFTNDVNRAAAITQRLQAGIVWVNGWGESPAEMSVGGWKNSGLGVENGRQGLEAWTRNRSVLVDNSGQVPTAFAKL